MHDDDACVFHLREDVECIRSNSGAERLADLTLRGACAHAAPGQALPEGLDYQLQSAGELLALLAGWRGLVMVQVWAGWTLPKPSPAEGTTQPPPQQPGERLPAAASEGGGGQGEGQQLPGSSSPAAADAAAQQPVLNPFVLTLMGQAAASKEVGVVTSTISGERAAQVVRVVCPPLPGRGAVTGATQCARLCAHRQAAGR